MNVTIPVSVGELVDKITILKIKKNMITDRTKLKYISEEYDRLTTILQQYKLTYNIEIPVFLVDKLYSINLSVWNIEDQIRIKERNQDFGEEFVELARSVYLTNDQRFDVKSQISLYGKSDVHEQKSYEKYVDA